MATMNQPANVLRVCQMMMAAMIVGIVIFAVVAVTMGLDGKMQAQQGQSSYLYPVLIAFAAGGIFASLIIHPIMLKQARQAVQAVPIESPENEATGIALRYWQTNTIISAAIAESLGFFAIVVYMISGSKPVLLMAGLSLALLVMRFPLRSRLDSFVSNVTGLTSENNPV